MSHSYWLNGLRLSGKKNDERVLQFQRKRLYPPEDSAVIDQPKCPLCCETRYQPSFDYICCELCEGWFHGDAYGLSIRNKRKIIGFRCHVCRERTPPLCPHKPAVRSEEKSELVETECNDVNQGPEKITDDKSSDVNQGPEKMTDEMSSDKGSPSIEIPQPFSAPVQEEEELDNKMDTSEYPAICNLELVDGKSVDDEMQDSES